MAKSYRWLALFLTETLFPAKYSVATSLKKGAMFDRDLGRYKGVDVMKNPASPSNSENGPV